MYTVILDIPGKPKYQIGQYVSKIQRDDENISTVERILEKCRLRFFSEHPSRLSSIFVCYNIENAHEWRIQKDKRKLFGYFIYELEGEDDIEPFWYNSEIYEKLSLCLDMPQYIHFMCKRIDEQDKLAYDYWSSVGFDASSSIAEGLCAGKVKVKCVYHFDKRGYEIK